MIQYKKIFEETLTKGVNFLHKPILDISEDEKKYPVSLMRKYWDRANREHIDAFMTVFPLEDEKGFQKRLKRDPRLLAFMSRNIRTIIDPVPDSPAAFALFDREGCLLDIYGSLDAVSALEADGIKKRSFWRLSALGPNAVTVGLEENRSIISIGEENYSQKLKKYAIFFAPIMLWVAKPPFDVEDYGGIAIILPIEKQQSEYLMLVSSIAHDIIMTLHFNQTAFMLYERSGRAVLSIDSHIRKGTDTITYCNEKIFEFFGIPPGELNFKPATDLLDPLPANKEFWAIVNEQKRVIDQAMVLTGQGKRVFCVVSSEIFQQPGINAGGVVFHITTSQQISATVAARIGNSAVLNFENVIGRSEKIKSAVQRGKMLAKAESNVMLLGESGVGKDIFAQAIHNTSRRSDKPFIAVNCGALPRDLIGSELFGYVFGAFTGAKPHGNIGKFELANGGTIFLDEIGELPLDLQVTLLRVVEQKQLMRLGGTELIHIDVKIISATNADISEIIEQKRFRSDLYYRLSTLRLSIPPLREREEDIILLAEYFIHTISSRIGRQDIMSLSAAAKELLLRLSWKGNVRELQNLMESIVQLYPDLVVEPQHILENLPFQNVEYNSTVPVSYNQTTRPTRMPHGKYQLIEQEIRTALEKNNENRSEAARYLGISRKTLYRHMEKLGML
jgi:transcriptional regulator with PAS, ATPase and Fis domain